MDSKQDNQCRECCPSCGVAYIEHMGLIGTCAELQRERRATLEAAGAITRYVEEVRRLREALEYIERVVPSESITKVDIYKVAKAALQRAGGGE